MVGFSLFSLFLRSKIPSFPPPRPRWTYVDFKGRGWVVMCMFTLVRDSGLDETYRPLKYVGDWKIRERLTVHDVGALLEGNLDWSSDLDRL